MEMAVAGSYRRRRGGGTAISGRRRGAQRVRTCACAHTQGHTAASWGHHVGHTYVHATWWLARALIQYRMCCVRFAAASNGSSCIALRKPRLRSLNPFGAHATVYKHAAGAGMVPRTAGCYSHRPRAWTGSSSRSSSARQQPAITRSTTHRTRCTRRTRSTSLPTFSRIKLRWRRMSPLRFCWQ